MRHPTTILDLLAGRANFVPVRSCSICGVPVGYHMPYPENTAVFFQSACGCSSASGEGRPITAEKLHELLAKEV